ncbi:hypothetical protein L596_026509 [Steinernema carpocapsae]|uniref:Trimethylguanosine synthase n=1 Tax=Steinernema carpocapsae TaxID=34508 RepID=A0A4V5ZY80_STECR|nr:hypothetical protein L596_026509 [Steinernema carpocapsae]
MSYRFDWEVIAEAEITRSSDTRKIVLSKAFVNDQDLMRLGEEPFEEIINAMDDLSTYDSNATEAQIPSDPVAPEHPEEEPEREQEPVSEVSNYTEGSLYDAEVDEDECPLEFRCQKKQQPYQPRRRKAVGGAQTSGHVQAMEAFESYWARVGEYVINRSWLNDYAEQMGEEAAEAFEAKTELTKPARILNPDKEGHKDVFAKMGEDATAYADWESLFTRFCEVVRQFSMRQHDLLISKSSVAGQCKDFYKKISRCGYVPGFRVAVAPSGEALMTGLESEAQDEEPAVKKPCPSPTDIVVKMDFAIYNQKPVGNAIVLYKNAPDAEAEPSSGTEESQSQPEDLKNFDFFYNAANDKKLLAKNASKYYKDDSQIMKYWWQRYRLFTKIDEGILLDREGWFSVTPERIAEHIADRLIQEPGRVILDAFAGVGGNSIQFALKGAHVIACDLDPTRLKCAKRNAEIYGVADQITFVLGNFFHVAKMIVKQKPIDAVFLSPPWGGPSYLNKREFDITTMVPGGVEIFEAAQELSPNIAYFLPRNTTVKQLMELAGPNGSCEIEHNVLNKKTKALTAYYGDLIAPTSIDDYAEKEEE